MFDSRTDGSCWEDTPPTPASTPTTATPTATPSSRSTTPTTTRPPPKPSTPLSQHGGPRPSPICHGRGHGEDNTIDRDGDLGFDDWDDPEDNSNNNSRHSSSSMPSDLRPSLHRPTDGRSQTPLLASKGDSARDYESPVRPGLTPRRSTFRERDPDSAKSATRQKYTYAAGFLLLSLVSFTIQTETAVYIQHNLKWNKAYCMLYLTHGSWSLLWPTQLLLIRLQKWNMPWRPFWRRHVQILRTTAQMVEHQELHPSGYAAKKSPVPYMLRTTAFVTCALTVAGGSWYVAVDLTTASDLTAIYNCSAFFAYAFSIPLLHERISYTKLFAVGVASAGVLVVAYGDTAAAKHGSKSGGGTGGRPDTEAHNRALGNIVIGVGSVLYGLYEVLYKKLACPPEGTSAGRGMIFANTFGSLIGAFTLLVLWIPLPVLHYTGLERFELPRGEAAWMLLASVLANATFSGSFLVLISLTSPVLSSVAALLTIFLVAIVDQLLPPPLNSPLSGAAIAGGLLIIAAFLCLSWATYREMDAERRRKADDDDVDDSDVEDL
ncbi:hypothetical protein BJ546DRAFT_1024540 [Cryomyces antarcticus]